jgi:hypothetical protein
MSLFGYCYPFTDTKNGVEWKRPSFNTLCAIPSNGLALPRFYPISSPTSWKEDKTDVKKRKD